MTKSEKLLLLTEFDVSGFFYNKNGQPCRKYLNIKRAGTDSGTPDLMVIMMNPGSSEQADEFKNVYDKEVPTKPDDTQFRLMLVMEKCNFDFARVLNVADLRNGKREKFIELQKEISRSFPGHSIFDESRAKEFKSYFQEGVPVILSWGVDIRLKNLTHTAFRKISALDVSIIGLKWEPAKTAKNKLEKRDNAYFHPLRRNPKLQDEWVEYVTKEIKIGNQVRVGE